VAERGGRARGCRARRRRRGGGGGEQVGLVNDAAGGNGEPPRGRVATTGRPKRTTRSRQRSRSSAEGPDAASKFRQAHTLTGSPGDFQKVARSHGSEARRGEGEPPAAGRPDDVDCARPVRARGAPGRGDGPPPKPDRTSKSRRLRCWPPHAGRLPSASHARLATPHLARRRVERRRAVREFCVGVSEDYRSGRRYLPAATRILLPTTPPNAETSWRSQRLLPRTIPSRIQEPRRKKRSTP
jgi:hypothetical protein